MTRFEEFDEEATREGIGALLRRHAVVAGAAVCVLVLVGFLAGRASRAGDPAVRGHIHETQGDHGAGEAQERWYTCSMHPQVRTTDPREKCPICGMDLIPVPAGDGDDGEPGVPRLSVSPRAAALMQVETTPVVRRPVAASLHLYGKVDVDETRLRHIAAWVPGRLERLYVNTTGEVVRAGQPMVEIYSPLLVAAQHELLQSLETVRRLPDGAAPSHRAGAEALAAAARDKLRLLGVSEEQIEEIAARGATEDRLTLKAPASGVVTAREATEGMYVAAGERIYSVADLGHLWVNLEVHEREVGWLRVGQPVVLAVRALPGETFRGTVAFILPEVDEGARTVRVRVNLPNPQSRLKPGMFVTGEVRAPVREADPLVIPASAPLITGRRAVVYVQLPDADRPTFEGREVVLGPRAGDVYVVRSGLAEGERVVSRGNFKIDSELQIRGRPSMMAPGNGEQAAHDHGAGAMEPTRRAEVPASRRPRDSGSRETAAATVFGEQVGVLVRHNFTLVKGLSDDDPPSSRQAAERLLKAVTGTDAGSLPAPERDLWLPLRARMEAGLSRLLEVQELDDMRPHFETFSEALTEAVRRFGAGTTTPVYRAVCPMVQGRRAYWLQADRPITNPYHGARMYSCGSIAETLVGVPENADGEGRS